MTAAQVVLGLLFVGACVYTIVGYPKRYGALSGRSRLFRTAGLFLLDLLLLLVLMRAFLVFEESRLGALRSALYWFSCLFMALSLLCIALLDALESYVTVRREQRAILQKAIQEEIERVEQLRKERAGAASQGADSDGNGAAS